MNIRHKTIKCSQHIFRMNVFAFLISFLNFVSFSPMFDNSVHKGGPPGIGPINPRMNPPRGPSIGGPIPGAYGPGGMRGPPPGMHRKNWSNEQPNFN